MSLIELRPRPTLFPYTTLFRSQTPQSGSRESHRPPAAGGMTATAPAHSRVESRRTGRTPSASLWQRPDGMSSLQRSEEHTSELQSHSDLVCRLLLEKKKKKRDK